MLRGAVACALGAVLIWWAAFEVDAVQRLDRTVVTFAMDSYQSPPDDLMRLLLRLLTGPVYAVFCLGVLATGAYHRRWGQAVGGRAGTPRRSPPFPSPP